MKLLLDSFWRAVAYCLHPKVIGLSLLPLVIGVALALGLGWLYWEAAVAAVRESLERWSLIDAALRWVESVAGGSFRSVIAPLVVVALAVPLIVVLSVLLVALTMTPAIVGLVEARRFAQLERRHGAGVFTSVLFSLGWTLAAGLALLLSLPLWLVPPLVLVLPPLIWGWLTCKVMSFDALAAHASRTERRALMRAHHWPLLGIGVVTGYLGAAPTAVWAASAVTLIFAPLLIVLSVWLYTLIFAFASLWFTHFVLAALAQMRAAAAAKAPPPVVIDLPAPVPPALPPAT
jgi:hypothetical protein